MHFCRQCFGSIAVSPGPPQRYSRPPSCLNDFPPMLLVQEARVHTGSLLSSNQAMFNLTHLPQNYTRSKFGSPRRDDTFSRVGPCACQQPLATTARTAHISELGTMQLFEGLQRLVPHAPVYKRRTRCSFTRRGYSCCNLHGRQFSNIIGVFPVC